MKTTYYRLIALGILLGVAGVVSAYTPPTTGAFGANTDAPLNITAINQDKTGGLSVGTFYGRGSALFSQDTFVKGVITGGNIQGNGTSTVAVGDSSYKVNALINGSISTKGTIQSNSLASGGGKKPVCANQDGTFFLCGDQAPQPPAVPPPSQTPYGQVSLYVDNTNQVGTNVVIRNSNNANMYNIELPIGSNMGMSNPYRVDPGSYNITSSDISCLPTWSPVPLPGAATDFVLNEGEHVIITLNC
ncbi:MAG TPA: hypothetical protein VGE18_03085 [Candidatus Paceibacterota bacterium]